MKPNFENCILNVTSSIMKKYKLKSIYTSLDSVDMMIKDSKHVFLILLDGLGKNIIDEHLSEKSFIKNNIYRWIDSVFPPTTVASTTAIISGLAPGVTGWIGWHQYFEEVQKDVILFKNKCTYEENILTINVPNTYISYIPFYSKIKKVKVRELYPSFKEGGFKTFKQMGKEIINISNSKDKTFTYCYWDNPDYMIHEFGVKHKKIKKLVNSLDKELSSIYNKCGESTSLIIIADHGLVDTEEIVLTDYPDFLDTLLLYPSIEARTVAFKVKDEVLFKILFEKYFGQYFNLYTSDEFVKAGFLGEDYNKAKPYLLDYVCVATDKYSLVYKKGDFTMKASHAGGTSDEMIVPLVLVKK